MTDGQKPEVILIDLSSIAHMIYHVSASDPDPDYTSKAVVGRVHALANGNPHVAICCDSGRSFRRDISADYKANRPERDEILMHQIALIREQLVADGFPVWAVDSFEADDLLAAATATARVAGHPVLIVTGDKDLLSQVTDAAPAVRVKSVQTGAVLDAEGVAAKLGVLPAQVVDYLTLVGDTSDNVKGAKSIGPKTAAALLKQFGALDDLYRDFDEAGAGPMKLTPAVTQSLCELRGRLPVVRALVTLRTDAPIDCAALFAERVPPSMASDTQAPEPVDDIAYAMPDSPPAPLGQGSAIMPPRHRCDGSHGAPRCADPECWQDDAVTVLRSTQLARVEPIIDAQVVPYERQLDPRTMNEAVLLAKDMFASRVFGAGSAPDAMARILAGREMGIPAVTSLRTIQIIEGHMQMSAQLIVGLVLRSGFATYFRCTERTNEAATFETQRGDNPPISLRFTIEDGRRAWPGTQEKWDKSGWGRNPADLCVARASSKLARLEYADICANVYTPDEIAEMKESHNG